MTEVVRKRRVRSARIEMTVLEAGQPDRPDLLLLHGNVSSSVFWRDTMEHFAADYHVLAPDLRGFGETQALPIDARRGLMDWVEDLEALVEAAGVAKPFALAGWSMGGGIAMQYCTLHPEHVRALILICPLPPYGFGGTRDVEGTPCWPDFAGSGAGTVNPDYVARLARHDHSADDANSPRRVMNQFYFRPPFRVAQDTEDAFVESMLTTKVGPGFYPGGAKPSPNWPGSAPGDDGVANAMAAGRIKLSGFADIEPQFPVLWVRGADDPIVSDHSLLDLGTLGQMGLVPGWPGAQTFPPQPMVSQTRAVLQHYQANGGWYEEFVVDNAAHAPHIERPEVVWAKMRDVLNYAGV